MLSQPGFCDAYSLRHAATCDLNHLHATKKPLHFLQTCDTAHCWSHHTKLQTASVLVYDCCNLINFFLNCLILWPIIMSKQLHFCSNAAMFQSHLLNFDTSHAVLEPHVHMIQQPPAASVNRHHHYNEAELMPVAVPEQRCKKSKGKPA